MKLIDLLMEKSPSAHYIRTTIRNSDKNWKDIGSGASASVWINKLDPDVAFKVIGGGDYDLNELNKSEKMCALAFVDFCVHEGTAAHPADVWRDHYPNILGINTDDPDVLQIKMETLKSIRPEKVVYDLDYLSRAVQRGETIEDIIEDNEALVKFIKKNKVNTMENLYKAVKHLIDSQGKYGKRHGIKLKMDLHGGNWLQRADGTIVAVDPWFGK